MYNKEGLQKGFAKAGLRLEFAAEDERQGGNAAIFGCLVRREFKGPQRGEYFVMQPGHKTNTITILDTNKEFGQVLLLVKEEKREWYEKRMNWRTHKEETITHTTSAANRKFLMGVDERQLFMCQVANNATTVQDAHAKLKHPSVYTAEGKMGRATRQGEWFFVTTTQSERDYIDEEIKKMRVFVHKKSPIGRGFGGKPHRADELVFFGDRPSTDPHASVRVNPRLQHGFSVRGGETFVRGKVRHDDHKTVEFKQWVRVIRNTEERTGVRTTSSGGTWID